MAKAIYLLVSKPWGWRVDVARHNVGTLTLEAGIPIESIAKVMGHSSIASTQTDPHPNH